MNDYDPSKLSTFIAYLDKNNLYGRAMSEYFPYEKCEWVKNVHELEVMSINKKKWYLKLIKKGYFLEVDLEYPNELRELHNDYPLPPEKVAVSNNMLSAYCKKIADE